MESVSKSGTSPSAVLALIGGAFMLAGGALALSMYGLWSQGGGGAGWWGAPMMGGGGGVGWMMPGFMWWAVGAVAGVSLVLGGVVLAGGYALSKRPAGEASSWIGVVILVASVIGLFTMSGFFIGPILGIIAGIMALAKR